MTFSVKQFYEAPRSGFGLADSPCDTGTFWLTADNLLHLVDESPVYRINWASPSFSVQLGAYPMLGLAIPNGFGGFHAIINTAAQFPTTIMQGGRYPNYDVRVAIKTTSGIVAVSATIATPAAPYGAGLEDPNVIGVATGTTSSTSGSWVIDNTFMSSAARRPTMSSITTSTAEMTPFVGSHLPGASVMARLQIVAYATGMAAGNAGVSVVGVQVREFPD